VHRFNKLSGVINQNFFFSFPTFFSLRNGLVEYFLGRIEIEKWKRGRRVFYCVVDMNKEGWKKDDKFIFPSILSLSNVIFPIFPQFSNLLFLFHLLFFG